MSVGQLPEVPLKEECAVSKLLFRQENAAWLATPSFVPHAALIVLRFVIAVFCVVTIIWSGADENSPKWLIFLTNWGYFVLTVAVIGLFVLSVEHSRLGYTHRNKSAESRQARQAEWRWYHSLVVLLVTMAADMAIIITALYWTLLDARINFVSISTHALNAVFILVELLCMGNVKLHLLHLVYGVAIAAVYVIFSVIYTFSGGTNTQNNPYIYKPLDWKGAPGTGVAIAIPTTLVAVPLVHVLLFFLVKARTHVALKLAKKRDHDTAMV